MTKKPKLGRDRAAVMAREDLFIEAFIRTGNKAASIREAGYTDKNQTKVADRMLLKARVQSALAARRAELQAKFECSTDNTIGTLAKLCFFDPAQLFDGKGGLLAIGAMPEAVRMALAGIKARRIRPENEDDVQDLEILEVRFLDRGSNIERLMKHLGLFEKDNQQKPVNPITELLEYVASHGGPIQVRPR